MRILVLIYLLASAVVWSADSFTIKDDLRARGIVYRSAIGRISPEEFDKTAIGLLASGEIIIGAFAVFPSERDYFWAGPRHDLFDSTYDLWRSYLVESGVTNGRCPEMQEAIIIDRQLRVRRVDSECRVTKTTLRQGVGRALDMRVAGRKLEILHVGFQTVRTRDRSEGLHVRVYARVDGQLVNEWVAREATAELKRMVGAADLSLALRADALFLSDGGFPRVFLLDGKGAALPTKDDYVRSRMAFCLAMDPWPTNCFIAHGR